MSCLKFFVEIAELGYKEGNLHIVNLEGGVGLLEVTDDVVFAAIVLWDAVQHQRPRTHLLNVRCLDAQADRESSHDEDAEGHEEDANEYVNPQHTVVAWQVGDCCVAKINICPL